MNRILIRYTDDLSDEEALNHALIGFRFSLERTGIIEFNDGVMMDYSNTSKYPSVTIWRKNEDKS